MDLNDLLASVREVPGLPLDQRFQELDRLAEQARRALEGEELAQARAAVSAASRVLFDLARTDRATREALHASVLARPWDDASVLALGGLEDSATYALVREQAAKQFALEYGHTHPAFFYALASFARRAAFADDASALLLSGFDRVVAEAHGRGLINQVAFHSLANVAATLRPTAAGPVLQQAFQTAAGFTQVRTFYELRVTCGTIAVALAAVGQRDAIADFDRFLPEDRSVDEAHETKVRYARWLLGNNGEDALAFLSDPEVTRNLGFAAAALADLDDKGARGPLSERMATLNNPVTEEVFKEASARLEKQAAPPAPLDRMIWMFGRLSPYERMNGRNDNVFAQRARGRTDDPGLVSTYEADDSPDED